MNPCLSDSSFVIPFSTPLNLGRFQNLMDQPFYILKKGMKMSFDIDWYH